MKLDRRQFIQNLGLTLPVVSPEINQLLKVDNSMLKGLVFTKDVQFKQSFSDLTDRIWIGKSFWSVPMEDWEIKNKRLEFSGVRENARLQLLTHFLQKEAGDFKLSAELGLLEEKKGVGAVGFSIGIKDLTDPINVKATCFTGKGIQAGVDLNHQLFIANEKVALPASFNFQKFSLEITGHSGNGKTTLTLTAVDNKRQKASLNFVLDRELEGYVALENNINLKNGSTFWWTKMELSGSKVAYIPHNSFGPVLWTMYTISRSKLKMTAQLPPVGKKDSQQVDLHLFRNNAWEKVQTAIIETDSYTAHFVLDNWDTKNEVSYKVLYKLDGELAEYPGTIRQEPTGRPLKFGGLTCQNHLGFPYRPLVENLEKINPDMLFFSGDQLYEENGGYPIKRFPEDKSILSYLGKWYMFGWAFGNIMRDRPTICTPDDHDVFQGNLWGEAGELVSFEKWEKVKDAHGGFVQTPKMVNVVNKTQCGHLPDPYTKDTLKSGITNWFTSLQYGRVSFAIVSDRLFKSGPEMIRKGVGRIDHVTERMKQGELEADSLSFFGDLQMEFLHKWIEDWQDADMKVLLSQTLFSNVGTHHGPQKEYFFGDMDSGGWPKKQRDEVLKVIRKAAAFHINGDQHVPFLVQYSIDEPRDSGWTFCTPAISTGYPRWGQPDAVNIPFTNRPAHNLPNTGCYRDIFGNDNYIYAVGNPEDDFSKEKNRYLLSQMKSSGFGLITFDTQARTIKIEAFRFLADLDKDTPENTFPGWPFTINQHDNDGRRAMGYLPRLKFKQPNQLVKIINEATQEVIQIMRSKGDSFVASVFENGKYTIVVGEDTAQKTLKGIEISSDPKEELSIS
ncbi:alkaline phosphatase D family protein [Runella salmonicolor]|uniref:Alkaline phosphatase D family protein n=1 Tax=Runella salmonicolor TaxID=2950278 RepID=A0ABT1FV16_9BACT|nr:alkaline phosphatase D family protein [Runella salmonicolor]MCP1384613.1 alkaline phosphatase D family protein [Runella salmonicolor]